MLTIGDILSAIDSLKRRATSDGLPRFAAQTAGDALGGAAATGGDLLSLLQRGLTMRDAPAYGDMIRSAGDSSGLADSFSPSFKLGELAGPPMKLAAKIAMAGAIPALKLAGDLPQVGKALEGLPATAVGPNAAAQQAALDYMASTGRAYEPPTKYAAVNPGRASQIADAYDAMKHAPDDPEVRRAYDALVNETMQQWDQIKKTGLKVDFIDPAKGDPYGKPSDALRDIQDNNHLWVFPTEGGFGGSASKDVDITGNPLLQPAGEINGRPVVANDIFRIVHDYFGHAQNGVGFRAGGEENAFLDHAAMFSPEARRALATETRGQNSWVNFGPFGEQNRVANGADTQYAPQKTGLLPEWVSDPASAAPVPTFPWAAERYPEVGPPTTKFDPKKGKEFPSRQLTDEGQQFMDAWKQANAQVEAGHYTPFFDVEQRFHANPQDYPLPGNTLTDAVAKTQKTIDKWKAMYDTPEIRQKLGDLYDAGKDDPMKRDWYALGQVEQSARETLGDEAGKDFFRNSVAMPMAATTSGNDPMSNWLLAAYGNYLQNRGLPIPHEAYNVPAPMRGERMGRNMQEFDRTMNAQGGNADAALQPKQHNFSGNFMGHTDLKTIDKQMMNIIDPKEDAPPKGSYGVVEQMLRDELQKRGAGPMENGQDTIWLQKKGVGEPMISTINKSIARTSLLTGLPQRVIWDNFLRKAGPMYALGGVSLGTLAAMGGQSQESE